jgi:adenosine deaminase
MSGLRKVMPVRDLRLLPKAHLHTHLESTVRPGTIRELGGEPPVQARPFSRFSEFAGQRTAVRALLRKRWRFRRIAGEFCQDDAAQGFATRRPPLQRRRTGSALMIR